MICYKCGKDNPLVGKPGFRETCFACGEDLHCCKNCKFHDVNCYNECHETQADRVVEKTRANFCEYFQIGSKSVAATDPTAEAKKKLEALFKK